MKKYIFLNIILIHICIFACSPEPEPTPEPELPIQPVPTIEIDCPADMSILLSNDTVQGSTLTFPPPSVVSSCDLGEFSYTINYPEKIQAGMHTIEYYASNPCGVTDTCSISLTAIDYRTRFVGTYTGIKICYAYYNYSEPISEDTITVQVSLTDNPNTLLVDGHELVIDSAGSYPPPSCCGYRWYAQQFWDDNFSMYINVGALASPIECRFRGKRQ